MFRILIAGLAATFALIGSAVAQDQNDLRSKTLALGWIKAPATAPIAGVAHFKLTNGQMALGASDTSRFLQLEEEKVKAKEDYNRCENEGGCMPMPYAKGHYDYK